MDKKRIFLGGHGTPESRDRYGLEIARIGMEPAY